MCPIDKHKPIHVPFVKRIKMEKNVWKIPKNVGMLMQSSKSQEDNSSLESTNTFLNWRSRKEYSS
jgi:hypothetical protein